MIQAFSNSTYGTLMLLINCFLSHSYSQPGNDVTTVEDEVMDFVDPGTHDGIEIQVLDDSDFSFIEVQKLMEEKKMLSYFIFPH